MKKRLFWTALGALLAYFFDPQNGKRRRNMTRDRLAAFGRRSAAQTQVVSQAAYAARQKVTHLQEEPKPQPDDVTLARKVETELFRDPEIPKGQINVNAVDGVVELRGEVKRPELVKELEKQARKVQGVRDVNNLLHTPGTPPPTAPERSRSRG
jgi:osmotically-inducible protein OsmY